MTGEDGEVDGTLKVVEDRLAALGIGAANAPAEENHGATRTTQRLVCSGGNDIRIFERCGDDFSSDEARDMGHVDHEISANLVSDLTHALVVDETAVCGGTSDENLGSVHESILFEAVIINQVGIEVEAVGEGLEVG